MREPAKARAIVIPAAPPPTMQRSHSRTWPSSSSRASCAISGLALLVIAGRAAPAGLRERADHYTRRG